MTAPKVYAAISAVMADIAKEGISKDRRNQQQGYNFRGIDDVYNALSSILARHKLVILPSVQDMQREERTTAKGGLLIYTILTVDFTLVSAEDGTQHVVRMKGEAMDSADKSCNKAQSAALKYACLEVFMIPTEGDNDADATTHQPVAKARTISAEQVEDIEALILDVGADRAKLLSYLKISDITDITIDNFERVKSVIEKKRKPAQEAQ